MPVHIDVVELEADVSDIDLNVMGIYRNKALGYEVKFFNHNCGTLVKSHPVVEKQGRALYGVYTWVDCLDTDCWIKLESETSDNVVELEGTYCG